MGKKVAIVTQSYINDFRECKLLCESIDRFAPEIDHFVFVNDEDFKAFAPLNYANHHIHKKGEILPKYLLRIPFKIAGHHFSISPITIPVREWIIQQICKLGVFEVIGNEYDAIFNIDSETVLMREIDLNRWIDEEGRFMLFRNVLDNEPSKAEYEAANKKLLALSDEEFHEACKWNFMNIPTCFERTNTELLLKELSKRVVFGGWKRAICNTYRFSENYLYATFVCERLNLNNHFVIEERNFPLVGRVTCKDSAELCQKIRAQMQNECAFGICLQKKNRKSQSSEYIDFDEVVSVVKSLWN